MASADHTVADMRTRHRSLLSGCTLTLVGLCALLLFQSRTLDQVRARVALCGPDKKKGLLALGKCGRLILPERACDTDGQSVTVEI